MQAQADRPDFCSKALGSLWSTVATASSRSTDWLSLRHPLQLHPLHMRPAAKHAQYNFRHRDARQKHGCVDGDSTVAAVESDANDATYAMRERPQ